MDDNGELKQKLVEKIQARRATIDAFVREQERRNDRLTNLSIWCTAATALFTAGPALGGEKFNGSVQQLLGLASESSVWRTLCFAAVVLSVVAAVANNLYKSHDVASRLAKAEAARALLDGLDTSLEFGQLPLEEAAKQFQQILTSAAFIPDP